MKSIPELAPFSKQERREILLECQQRAWARISRWELLYVLLMSIPTGLIMMVRVWPLSFRIPVVIVWSWGWALFMIQRRIARLLPEIRKKVGGYCIACGYDIRATPEKCPECGVTVPGRG